MDMSPSPPPPPAPLGPAPCIRACSMHVLLETCGLGIGTCGGSSEMNNRTVHPLKAAPQPGRPCISLLWTSWLRTTPGQSWERAAGSRT